MASKQAINAAKRYAELHDRPEAGRVNQPILASIIDDAIAEMSFMPRPCLILGDSRNSSDLGSQVRSGKGDRDEN